jgi:hypothetical protein
MQSSHLYCFLGSTIIGFILGLNVQQIYFNMSIQYHIVESDKTITTSFESATPKLRNTQKLQHG